MEEYNQKIQEKIVELINCEPLIGDELKDMFLTFIDEEKDFPFGKLCVMHYKDQSDSFKDEIYNVAAAIELIIFAFDIVDDIQDQDKPYIWTETPALSLNIVLTMLTIASKIIRQSNFEHRDIALNHIETYILSSINGQHLDLLNQSIDEASYLQIIELKSASLCMMSCIVGIILATGKVSQRVLHYSRILGIIQQIKNDIQGLKEWNHTNDLLNKKITLPIIYIFNTKNSISFQLKEYYDGVNISLDLVALREFVINSGALQYSIAMKNIYKNAALAVIENVVRTKELSNYLTKLMK